MKLSTWLYFGWLLPSVILFLLFRPKLPYFETAVITGIAVMIHMLTIIVDIGEKTKGHNE